ncbi:MAG: hypothetical protein IIT52_02380, partial [Candidatus Methanomethylophilus sp.]|nr:hypothetical protein [Methanomethylophilus sp.]
CRQRLSPQKALQSAAQPFHRKISCFDASRKKSKIITLNRKKYQIFRSNSSDEKIVEKWKNPLKPEKK